MKIKMLPLVLVVMALYRPVLAQQSVRLIGGWEFLRQEVGGVWQAVVTIGWNEGKLVQAKIYSGSGGLCRLSTPQPVKVIEAASGPAQGANTNVLNTTWGIPAYEKNNNAKLVDLTIPKRYTIDFNTLKGKTYTIVPV